MRSSSFSAVFVLGLLAVCPMILSAAAAERSAPLLLADVRQDTAKLFFANAFELYRAEDFRGAKEKFELGLDIDPTDPLAHYYLAETLFALGQQSEGWKHYEKAAKYGPNTREGEIAASKVAVRNLAENKEKAELEQKKALEEYNKSENHRAELRKQPFVEALRRGDIGPFLGRWQEVSYGPRKVLQLFENGTLVLDDPGDDPELHGIKEILTTPIPIPGIDPNLGCKISGHYRIESDKISMTFLETKQCGPGRDIASTNRYFRNRTCEVPKVGDALDPSYRHEGRPSLRCDRIIGLGNASMTFEDYFILTEKTQNSRLIKSQNSKIIKMGEVTDLSGEYITYCYDADVVGQVIDASNTILDGRVGDTVADEKVRTWWNKLKSIDTSKHCEVATDFNVIAVKGERAANLPILEGKFLSILQDRHGPNTECGRSPPSGRCRIVLRPANVFPAIVNSQIHGNQVLGYVGYTSRQIYDPAANKLYGAESK